MTPEELTARVLYKDTLIIVLNKPSGIPVHSGLGKIPPLDLYFEYLRFGAPQAPSLAHRLDKDTSGCLILGRHAYALRLLGKLFLSGKVRKTYWAIVHGTPEASSGTINLPLAQQNTNPYHWRMKVDLTGKDSITDYQVISSDGKYSFLELTPITGRTHQLRVHCAAIGCPIVGDVIYGMTEETQLENTLTTAPSLTRHSPSLKGLHLHARAISLSLYPKKPTLRIIASPPAHMEATLQRRGLSKDYS